ncbi:MAG: hypothetical protein ACREXY_19180, partial [Gammaproteobacteria bacterium]
ANSSKLAGQPRLLAVGGAGTAGFALGPMVAVLALSVAAEMVARHQTEVKLRRILTAVDDLRADLRQTQHATLNAAERAIEDGSAALLDRIAIPDSIGLGSALNDLRNLRHQSLEWLTNWERAASDMKVGRDGVNFRYFVSRLGMEDSSPDEFVRKVAVTYRALAMDARATVLTGAEAALANPDVRLDHLQARLALSLSETADAQDRLTNVARRLAEPHLDLTVREFMAPGNTQRAATIGQALSKLAFALADAPPTPPTFEPSGAQILELRHRLDGSVQSTSREVSAK